MTHCLKNEKQQPYGNKRDYKELQREFFVTGGFNVDVANESEFLY